MRLDNYRRLGDYIRQVDVRNKDLAVTRLLGVSVSKEFIPSIANTIGTDMSTYKIVAQGQFVYISDTSRRGDKIAIALLSDNESALTSSIYTVFEVCDKKQLLPQYLMMWFRRSEFDRYARFHSHGSAREIFDWDEMCDVRLPIPSIDKQRELVNKYEIISRRININKNLISKLEETAQALYRKYFIDDIDLEHLPNGWKVGKFSDIAEITSGTTCKYKVNDEVGNYIYPIVGATGIIGYSTTYNQTDKLMTVGRVGTLGVVNRFNERLFAADNVLVIKSSHYEYCYQQLKSINYEEITKGGVQNLITQKDLKNMDIILPPQDVLCSYEKQSTKIYSFISIKCKNNRILNTLKSMIISTIINI